MGYRNEEFWLDARESLQSDSGVVAAGFNTLVDAILIQPEQREDFEFPARIATAVEIEEVDTLATIETGSIVVSSDIACLEQANERGFRTGYLMPTNEKPTLETTTELFEDSPEYCILDRQNSDQLEDDLDRETNEKRDDAATLLETAEATILRHVQSAEAAKSSLTNGTATNGAATNRGALLSTHDAEDVYDVGNTLREGYHGNLAVEPLEITRIEQIGMGERSCVDVTSLFSKDEGMVVGSTDVGGLFVCSESHSPPNMSPRPFRVNAGSVHSYITIADGETEYLTELSTGNTVLCVDSDGNTRPVSIGRKKTETRPLVLVTATAGDQTVEAVLQDHCHVRLMGADDNPIAITEASVGDNVLGHVRPAKSSNS